MRRRAPPTVPTAESAILIDGRDGTVMFAKRPDAQRSIASTTKLMTALLALESADPDEVFTAPAYSAAPAESRINLREGEQMTVEDLLEALLLESANDAAAALAENISGSRDAFVEEMNERAEELELDNTSYANPIGLDEAGNHSTARDLATLTRGLLQDPRVRADRRHARGGARVGHQAARDRQPQRPRGRVPVGERRQDGLHAERGERAGGLRRGARRRAGDLSGARRADRGRPRRRDARAAQVGARPVQPRARARLRPRARPRGHRVPRRDRPAGAAPRRGPHAARRPARSAGA